MNPLMLDLAQLSEVKKQESQSVQVSSSPGVVSFEELMSSSMKQVNKLQLESDDMIRRLAVVDVEDISEVVLAASRAEVAQRMLIELRNKFVEAYQQLSRITG